MTAKSAGRCGSSSTWYSRHEPTEKRRFNPSRLCVLLNEVIGVYRVVLTGGNSDDGNNSNASLGS
jgi:hypothetical protein